MTGREPVELLVVPCGRAKLAEPAPARLLYTGHHFRFVLGTVQAAADQRGGLVRILSAQHGLTHPDDQLAPYDVTMLDPGSITPARLAGQLAALASDRPITITAYLPQRYLARLDEASALVDRCTVNDAFAGCRGIGEQRHVIAALARNALSD